VVAAEAEVLLLAVAVEEAATVVVPVEAVDTPADLTVEAAGAADTPAVSVEAATVEVSEAKATVVSARATLPKRR
jgi:hypothetical protein